MSEAFFVSKAFFENAFEKIKRFREKTIMLKNDTGSTPNYWMTATECSMAVSLKVCAQPYK